MLLSFRLANHRSIRAEQELTLQPVDGTDGEALTVAAVFGANASGKSSLLDGLDYMSKAVQASFPHGEPIRGVPRFPFRLDPKVREEPSHFVVDLMLDGVRYTYGFSLNDDNILEEWLYSYPEQKQRIIFERTNDAIEFGSTVAENRARADVLKELNRPNSLFLSWAIRVRFEELLPVYLWFAESLSTRTSPSDLSPLELGELAAGWVDGSAVRLKTVRNLLIYADFGISDIRVARVVAGGSHDKQLVLIHSTVDEPFSMADESAGTRCWLDMLLVVLRVLEQGGTLLVDEIDTSLHPRLTARLLALFQDPETNPNGAQLICTTHDATLLSPILGDQVLVRDQVWFTEKNAAGETGLYPLSDFIPRKNENVEQRYLGGSYGGVPIFFPEDMRAAIRGSAGNEGT